jgi:hypothetical protein
MIPQVVVTTIVASNFDILHRGWVVIINLKQSLNFDQKLAIWLI